MINPSFNGVSCLTVATDKNVAELIVSTLKQIGMVEITKATELSFAVHCLSETAFSVVICAALDQAEYLEMVEAVRNHRSTVVSQAPIICISESWQAEHISALRNAGASIMAMFPVNMRSMLKHVTRAITDKREYINTPTYRGPCRRLELKNNYAGPFRRASDANVLSRTLERPAAQDHARAAGSGQAAAQTHADIPPPPDVARPNQAVSNDPIKQQTGIVLHHVETTAQYIITLLQQMKAIPKGPASAALSWTVSESLDRWVNLMGIARARVDIYGCSTEQLASIRTMQSSFQDHVSDLSTVLVGKLTDECARLASGADPIRLGCGAVLSRRLGVIQGIMQAMGNPGEDEQKQIDHLADSVAQVVKLEAEHIVLPEFSAHRGRS